MPETPGQLHHRLDAMIRARTATAAQADGDAVSLALGSLASAGVLDEGTITFLHQARGLVLGATAALSSVTDAHRVSPAMNCLECGMPWPCRTLKRVADCLTIYGGARAVPIDRAEAWRRADQHYNAGRAEPSLLVVQEFDRGYAVRPVHALLPLPPQIPTLDQQVLVVDKTDGALTCWPLMHLPALSAQYTRYKQNRPMTLPHPTGTPLPQAAVRPENTRREQRP